MIIEIRKNQIFVDGEESKTVLFSEVKAGKNRFLRVLDFRKSNLKDLDEIKVLNKSGKNYELISTNDWSCTLKTSKMVTVKNGYIPYMSQKSI